MEKLLRINRLILVCILLGIVLSLTSPVGAETSEQIMQQIERLRDSNKEVRHQTFQTLAEFGKSAVPILLTALEKEQLNQQDETTRVWVIHGIVYALGSIGDKSAVPYLYRLLEDRDGNVAIYATEALCSMRDESIIFDLMKFAVKKIESIDENKAKKMAQELNEQNADGMTRLTAAASLAFLPMNISAGIENMGEPIIPTLMKALNDKDYGVRFFAVGLLENLSMSYTVYKAKVIESFIVLLADDNLKVRQAAGQALAFMTDIKYKTGNDFGEDPKQWQAWWEKNKEQFK
ncbi:MAG: HEAT repeat domain-containing protein [Candidatus Omnitrophota bacterium]